MCCPMCETGELRTSIPAIGDQEPIMTCGRCGAHFDSACLGLYMDQAIDREVVVELNRLLKAA